MAAINCSDKLTLKSQKKTVGGFSRVKKTTTLFSIIEGNIGEQVSKKLPNMAPKHLKMTLMGSDSSLDTQEKPSEKEGDRRFLY